MNSRAILLAELEEKSQKNKELGLKSGETEVTGPGLGEGYDPYDNPGTHKTPGLDDTTARRVLRRP